jgi:GxxExxY protein
LKVEQQAPIPVYYSGEIVGDYFADIFVENWLIVELKVVKELTDAHKAQCLNYLAGTKMPLCLLFNFYYPKVQIKRVIARTENIPIPKHL